jgi:hypothetical protein
MGKGEGGEPACLTDFHFSSPVDSLTGFYGRCVAFGHRPIEPRRIAKRSVLAEISKGTGFDSKVGTMRNERSLSSAEEDCSGAEGEMRSRSVNPILPMHGFLGFAKDRITSGLPQLGRQCAYNARPRTSSRTASRRGWTIASRIPPGPVGGLECPSRHPSSG